MPQPGSEPTGTTTREHQRSSMLVTPACQSIRRISAPVTGSLSLYFGCMFSGKTTALIKHLVPFPADQRVLFKHALDTRYRRDAVVSHNGLSLPAFPITKASELTAHCGERVTMVGFDEGHFFDARVMAEVLHLVSLGINIAITALDYDSWGEPFPLMQSLAKKTNSVTILTATCAQCGGRANRTQRLTPIIEGGMIGGCESYEPRCAQCWHPPPETRPRLHGYHT